MALAFNEWKAQAVGRRIDVDGAYGAQCVDVYLDYIVKVIGVSEWSSVSGWGDAAQLYPKANQTYFTKYDSSGIPQKGDVIFYGPTRTNSAGHVAVVDSADGSGVTCIEQDGFNPSGSCYVKFRPWNGTCIGWQRPKRLVISAPQGGDIMDTNSGKELYRTGLHREPESDGAAGQWNGKTASQALSVLRGAAEWQAQDNLLKTLPGKVQQMQTTINSLSDRPTKEEYAKVQAQLNDTVTELAASQAALEAEKANIKTVTVEKTVEVEPGWLTTAVNFIRKVLRINN